MEEIKQQDVKIFNQSFIQIFMINFFVMLSFYSLTVVIGPYAVNELGESQSVAGLLVGITVIGSLVARLLSGFFMEKLKTKYILFLGAAILLVSLISYVFAKELSLLVAMRFIQGIAIGLISTVTNTVVVLVIPSERKGEGISYFSLSTVIATALGPFIALLLVNAIGYHLFFILASLIGVLVFIAIFFVHEKVVTLPKKVQHQAISIKHFIEPKAIPLAVVMLIATISYSAIQSNLTFFMSEQHMANYASFFFLIYAISIFVSRPFTGVLSDRKNENFVTYPCLILLIAGFILLSQVSGPIIFILSAIFIGLGFGNLQSSIQSIIVKNAALDRVGVSTSTYFILFDLAFGVGPVLLGIIAPMIGFKALFELMSIVGLVALILYYLVHGRHVSKSL
ncbi:MAG: MFS transporter [Lactococcus plantarum]|nr:MFS transporter [Lactococcus plantarum]MDN6069686.1 MFS transporter [Lactococcus plantarum]MDN6084977.1 MFS transporter [Lactococcus plantarum]